MRAGEFVAKLALMLGGLLIWAGHFTILYMANALACARHFADLRLGGIGIVPIVIGLATILALAALVTLLVAAYRTRPAGNPGLGFMHDAAVVLAALSLLAVIYNGIPVLIVPPCA